LWVVVLVEQRAGLLKALAALRTAGRWSPLSSWAEQVIGLWELPVGPALERLPVAPVQQEADSFLGTESRSLAEECSEPAAPGQVRQ